MSIRQIISNFDREELAGRPHEVIRNIQDMLEQVPVELRDQVMIDIDAREDYGCTIVEVQAYYYRPETAEEIRKFKQSQERIREYRRRQYEDLKKEFG